MGFPSILEKLILTGEAEYDNWSYGIAGAGTLKLTKNQFIIMTDFDYFYFLDEPPFVEEDAPAVSTIVVHTDIFNISYTIAGGPATANVLTDPTDIPGTAAAFQIALNAAYPGFSSLVTFDLPTKTWTFVITSDSPGTIYNGVLPVIVSSIPVIPIITAFAGGATATTFEDIQKNVVHQLEFRLKGKKYSWIIHENVQNAFTFVDGDKVLGGFNVRGCYQKRGLYIPFTEEVQIGIVRVPDAQDWALTYSTLGASGNKANEPTPPAGYGMVPPPAPLPAVTEVLFDGVNEQYLPLTEDRSDVTLKEYREQFKVDYVNGRELFNPQGVFFNQLATLRYPIINIGYVRVNMKWDDFLKRVNQLTKQ